MNALDGIKRIERAIQQLDLEQQSSMHHPRGENGPENEVGAPEIDELEFSDEDSTNQANESLADRARRYLERRQLRESQRVVEEQEKLAKEVKAKPSINRNSAKMARERGRDKDIGSALYANAETQRLYRELMAQEQIQDSKSLASPAITKRAAELVREGSVGDRLYQGAMSKKSQVAQPAVNKVKKNGNPRKSLDNGASLYDRALESMKMKEALAKRREEKLKKMAKPRLSSKSKEIAANIGQSSTERLLKQKGAIHKKHTKVENREEAELTFKPKINPTSKKILSESPAAAMMMQQHQQHQLQQDSVCGSETSTSTYDRLYHEYNMLKSKRSTIMEQGQKSQVEKDLKECTFKPSISHYAPLEEVRKENNQRDIVDRLNEWSQRREQRLEQQRIQKEQEEMQDNEYTFAPKINNQVDHEKPKEKKNTGKKLQDHKGFQQYVDRISKAREEKKRLANAFNPKSKWENRITVPIGPKLGTAARKQHKDEIQHHRQQIDESVAAPQQKGHVTIPQQQRMQQPPVPQRAPPPPPPAFEDERIEQQDDYASTYRHKIRIPSKDNNNDHSSSPKSPEQTLQGFKLLQTLLQ